MAKYKRSSKAGLCWRIVVSAKGGKKERTKGQQTTMEYEEIRKFKIIFLLAMKQKKKLDKQEN